VSLEIRRVRTRAEREQALALRHRVFCVEQGVPPNDEQDGRDPEGLHLVAFERGRVIGTCRLVFVGGTVQFSRLAVEPDARRRGVASLLLKAADSESRASGARRMVLHAQTYAKDLYARHGYRSRGPRFYEAGIEHVAMEKRLG
jgi:predicted GNAT family N-acyltransferase